MIFACAFLIFGAAAIAGAIYWTRARARICRWPVAPGQILEREAIVPTNRVLSGSLAFRWEPTVRYRYRVADVEYSGDRIYLPWAWTDTRAKCERFLATIPDDAPVRYDPANPSISVLFPAPLSSILWYAATGLFFFLLGGVLLLGELMRDVA